MKGKSRRLGIAAVSLALTVGAVSPAAAGQVVLSPYAPFPHGALRALGASLARPTHEQVSTVKVSVSRAYAVARTQAGVLPKGSRVTVRLGLFSDSTQGKSAFLAYAVIFDGVDVPSLGLRSGPGGHEIVVIVSARTGRPIEAFSYR